MKRSRFTQEQIIGVRKEHQAGATAPDLCRKHGISDWTDVRALTWPALAAILTAHGVRSKAGTCIVPAVFSGGRRKKAEAVQIEVATLDSDSGATLDESVIVRGSGAAPDQPGATTPSPAGRSRSGLCGRSAASGRVSAAPEVLVGDVLKLRGGVREPHGLAPKHRLRIGAGMIRAGLLQLDEQRLTDHSLGRAAEPSEVGDQMMALFVANRPYHDQAYTARPPQLEAIIATRPEDAALAARITWATMSEARRSDPLFAALVAAGHATAEQVDDLFWQAAEL